MNPLIKILTAFAASAMFVTGAFSQSTKQVRGEEFDSCGYRIGVVMRASSKAGKW